MVVEPTKQDLVWRQLQEILELLILVQQTIQFWMELDVHSTQQTFPNDLPNQAKDQDLLSICNVLGTNVDDTASDRLRGHDDDVVILRYLESIEGL